MGILDRFRRKKKAPVQEGERPTEEVQPPKHVASFMELDTKVAEEAGVPTESTESEHFERYRRMATEAVIKREKAAKPVVEEVKEEQPRKESRIISIIKSAADRRNWSPNAVGEYTFNDLKSARAYAKAIRKEGYMAKLVRLSDGTYKVYVYRKGRADPLAKLNRGLKLKELQKTSDLNKVMGKNALKALQSKPSGRADLQLNMPAFPRLDLGDLEGLKGNLLDELNWEFDMDFELGGVGGGKKKAPRKRKKTRR